MKPTDSIEHFNPLKDASDKNAPPPEAAIESTKPSLGTSSVSQVALKISVPPIPDYVHMFPLYL
jgi:hypothetical protein